MSAVLLGFLVLLILMIVFRVPIAFAMALVGVGGLILLSSHGMFDWRWEPYLKFAARRLVTTAQNYELSIIPLFILMGNFITCSGLSDDLYDAANKFIGRFKGGLAMATILSCGFFSAICGSSLATVATMGKVSLPCMRKFKYDDGLATACIASGGTLGILIPPSILLIMYGILTSTGIQKLFAAGFLPGLLGILFYLAAVRIVVFFNPSAGPSGESFIWREKLKSLKKVQGILLLFFVVLGGIYMGVFTPTEASGIGAGGAFLIAFLRRKLTWKKLFDVLGDTAKTTTVLFSILIGSLIFTNFISRSGLPGDLNMLISNLNIPPLAVIGVIMIIYIFLGMVFESISMVMLTIPIFFPIVTQLGLDPIWFGILVVVVTEISLITPPVGLNIFVLCSIDKSIKLNTVFKGIAPFVAMDIVRLLALIFFPSIVLFLPDLFFG